MSGFITAAGRTKRQNREDSENRSQTPPSDTGSEWLSVSLAELQMSGLLRKTRSDVSASPSDTVGESSLAITRQQTSFSAHYSKRDLMQFNVGDKVLVLIDHLKQDDMPPKQTGALPVNEYGYPEGQGSTTLEKKGPWIYVLATIKSIHFEENSRYYMIQRADSISMERAEAAWFKPIMEGSDGAQAAAAAAQGVAFSGRATRRNSATKYFDKVSDACRQCTQGFYSLMQKCKIKVKHFLFGMHPFSITIQISSVTFLVICSLFFLFGDQTVLAFLPASADYAYKVLLFVIWLILCVELIMEVFIRPSNYHKLIVSEDCYASSTVRFIDYFHLVFEAISLIIFIPELIPLFTGSYGKYDYFVHASSLTTVGNSSRDAILGHFYYCLIRLRIFSVIRHWKNMWFNRIYNEDDEKRLVLGRFLFPTYQHSNQEYPKIKDDDTEARRRTSIILRKNADETFYDKDKLDHVAKIGNALMVVNSHRAIILFIIIVGLLPWILIGRPGNGQNRSYNNLVNLLQELNVRWNGTDPKSCNMLKSSIDAWTALMVNKVGDAYHSDLVRATLSPIRCSFQNQSSVITRCNDAGQYFCQTWKATQNATSLTSIATVLGLRSADLKNVTIAGMGNTMSTEYRTEAVFDVSVSVQNAAAGCFFLQLALVIITVLGVAVLRRDASRLVISPLRRMLKIVLKYAENPLIPANNQKNADGTKGLRETTTPSGMGALPENDQGGNDALGRFETEQLITAVTKITDLLRKCWGVAGAGIISSNLAANKYGKTVVFNPTVPGKLVYALFGFAAIDDFNHLLRSLDQDVMILINDVANVVHSEVFRWGYGDRGQCNKNLGSAFLMVFRIGDFKEVEEKKEKATGVVFNWVGKGTNGKKSTAGKRGQGPSAKSPWQNINDRSTSTMLSEVGTLQLASLPGINDFTDRALIGMLKSFAGIQRNKSLKNWQKDFRLGAGVGAFSVEMIFGLDAGWAVEGAVGSEYKIDATYLSPHVNMASRMMSACRQYGLTILLSQDVEQLLSEKARSKLRHIDTVTVKGSVREQRIFTYDARKSGVNFFLYDRSPEQADVDSDNYSASIWDRDQDLLAMRSHISEEFLQVFNKGRDLYLAGSWREAIEILREANSILIENIMSEGLYHESDIAVWSDQILDRNSRNDSVRRIRNTLGDGPSQALISFMETNGGSVPLNWRGVRALNSK